MVFFSELRKVIWEDKVRDITFKARQRECLASTSLYLTVFISLEYVASRAISVHLEVDVLKRANKQTVMEMLPFSYSLWKHGTLWCLVAPKNDRRSQLKYGNYQHLKLLEEVANKQQCQNNESVLSQALAILSLVSLNKHGGVSLHWVLIYYWKIFLKILRLWCSYIVLPIPFGPQSLIQFMLSFKSMDSFFSLIFDEHTQTYYTHTMYLYMWCKYSRL